MSTMYVASGSHESFYEGRTVSAASKPVFGLLLPLTTLESHVYEIAAPIPVRVLEDGGQFVAEAVGMNEFGYGLSQQFAVKDLQQAIVELYAELETNDGRLGPSLLEDWEALRLHVRRK